MTDEEVTDVVVVQSIRQNKTPNASLTPLGREKRVSLHNYLEVLNGFAFTEDFTGVTYIISRQKITTQITPVSELTWVVHSSPGSFFVQP